VKPANTTSLRAVILGMTAALVVPGCAAEQSSAQQSASVEIAFVANAAAATVVLLDVATRAVVDTIDVNPDRVKASGPGAPNYAQDTDISPDGRTMYVSRGYMGDVAAFDIASGRMLWHTSLNTGRADHMAITKDGRYLFVSAMLDNRVVRVATSDGALNGYIVGGVYPHDNKISSDGTLLYNTSIGALKAMPRAADAPPLTEAPGAPFQITIADVNTFAIRERITTENAIRPWEFAPGEQGMYVQLANEHAVAFYDLTTNRVTKRLELPLKEGITAADTDFDAPHHGLAITPDGATLCLAGRSSDYAALVSTQDFKLLATIPVGDAPGWAEIADSGRVCMTTNGRSDDLSIISIADRKEIVRMPIGDGPKHITIAAVPASVVDAMKARR
jgi:DNA-binding beta-propeller fold protein YncE